MGQAYEFDVVLGIFPQTADRNSHTVFKIAVQTRLRTVGLRKVMNELFGGGRKLQLLSGSFKIRPDLFDFFQIRFFVKTGKNGCNVTVADRNTQALSGDGNVRAADDLSVFYVPPDLQGLFLGLFFLIFKQIFK